MNDKSDYWNDLIVPPSESINNSPIISTINNVILKINCSIIYCAKITEATAAIILVLAVLQ